MGGRGRCGGPWCSSHLWLATALPRFNIYLEASLTYPIRSAPGIPWEGPGRVAERVMRGLVGTFPRPGMQTLVPEPRPEPDLSQAHAFKWDPPRAVEGGWFARSTDEKKRTLITKPLECAHSPLAGVRALSLGGCPRALLQVTEPVIPLPGVLSACHRRNLCSSRRVWHRRIESQERGRAGRSPG